MYPRIPKHLSLTSGIGKSKADYEATAKFYNLTEPFLKALGDESDAEEFPFDLSPEELDIVQHFSTSSLILGRSGTGKTTCLLFKMLARHRARQSALKSTSDEQQVRQVRFCLSHQRSVIDSLSFS